MLLQHGIVATVNAKHRRSVLPAAPLHVPSALSLDWTLPQCSISSVRAPQQQLSSKPLLQDGIVTMVDAKHVHKRLDDEVPAGAINEALEQIAYADRLILNKTDLVS